MQTLDATLFRARIARFEKMADGILSCMSDVTPKNSTPKQRAQIATDGRQVCAHGRVSQEQLLGISDFIEAFVGEGISFRALPCGQDHLELGISGALLGRREYIQEERESLFSRFGIIASSWTCVTGRCDPKSGAWSRCHPRRSLGVRGTARNVTSGLVSSTADSPQGRRVLKTSLAASSGEPL